MDSGRRSKLTITALGNQKKAKRREGTKSGIGPTKISGKIVAGGKHPQSIPDRAAGPAAVLSVFSAQHSALSENIHQIWSTIVVGSSAESPKV
jgi:hypothetical protein